MEKFSIDFVSPANAESLAAEISFDDQLLCRIDRDRHDGALEIEFFHLSRVLASEVTMKFPLLEFLSVLDQVRSDLQQIPR